uniref:Uncharacterized protein n=1 Tax=Ovis aries TaxID=9940 RepID=A0AC11DJU3_SHEEP
MAKRSYAASEIRAAVERSYPASEVGGGCIFNLYAKYILQNASLDEAQAGIKIARRNINILRYVDDTTVMAESEEALKNLLMKVKEKSEKSGLITSWQIDGETMETVTEFIFLGSKSLQMRTAATKLKDACSLEEK